jgi:LDH2 family malate/lactate/ureidoglycolate dehydrogenase
VPVTIDRAELERFGVALLVAAGVAPAQARRAERVLMYADERGLTTHGHGALASIYLARLLDGRIDPRSEPLVLSEYRGCVAFDAGHGLGLAAMTTAVERAIELARRFGVSVATVRRSSHFGAAGFYAALGARAGCVAIAMTNCGRQRVVPPLGGSARLLGTNPIGAAVPAAARADFVLDMSTTAVAAGRVAAARREGRAVPPGWLLDASGGAVTDPEAYANGTADLCWVGGGLETGGAKGFGLGLLVELLCGPLAGAGFGPQEAVNGGGGGIDDRDVGHVALVIDPSAFPDGHSFAARADGLLATVAQSPGRGGAPVRYAGQPEAERAVAAETCGVVALADHQLEPLLELAAQMHVSPPAGLPAAPARATSGGAS